LAPGRAPLTEVSPPQGVFQSAPACRSVLAVSKRLVALIIFKEAQAWALRLVRRVVVIVRTFLECSP